LAKQPNEKRGGEPTRRHFPSQSGKEGGGEREEVTKGELGVTEEDGRGLASRPRKGNPRVARWKRRMIGYGGRGATRRGMVTPPSVSPGHGGGTGETHPNENLLGGAIPAPTESKKKQGEKEKTPGLGCDYSFNG